MALVSARTFEFDPIGHPLAAFQASSPLVLRNAASLDSQRCGLVRKGDRLVVLEEDLVTQPGVCRSRVALEADLGASLGWVTREKPSKQLLKTMRSQEGKLGFYTSLCSYSSPRKSPTRLRSPEDQAAHEARRAQESLASRVAKRRQKASLGRMPDATVLYDAPSAASDGTALSAPPEKPRRSSVSFKAQPSGRLLDAAAVMISRAKEMESKSFETFESKLANMLLKKKVKVDELVRSWDRNGDGGINKQEFRINVRALGFKDMDVREIDGLFDRIDDDHSVELELKELKLALKKLQADAAGLGAAAEQEKERAAALRQVAAQFEAAAATSAEHEQAEQKLNQMKNFPTIEKRIGDVLIKRNVKIGEVVSQWDKDGDGTVDATEFQQRVLALGVKAERWEVDELFGRLDESGDGELDIEEMKSTLTSLRDAAADGSKELEDQVSLVKQRLKLKKEAQMEASEALAAFEPEWTIQSLLGS